MTFDKQVERRGSGSYKWDNVPEDVLPLWVADMDFEVAPAIKRALEERVAHGVFGYTKVKDSYYEAIISWFKRRHQWTIDRRWIVYTSGVVPAISSAIRAIALPGEKVLVQTPVYNCFFSSIRNQGCIVEESPLKREGNSYVVDWDDFEARCADEQTTVFLLCNPHNPAGRVWTREELARMGEICRRHHVTVISDEIHCEIVMPGYKFTPFAVASPESMDQCVAFNSPSKNFNIAGLQIANIICKNDELRRRVERVINLHEVCDVNPFGPIALEAAYNESEQWLTEMNQYVWKNYLILCELFEEGLPQAKVTKLEGTYLAWVDISCLGMDSNALTKKLLHEAKVLVSSGMSYGERDGRDFIRINLACQSNVLMEGLKRMLEVMGRM